MEVAELESGCKAQLLNITLTVLLRGRACHTVVNMLSYLLLSPPTPSRPVPFFFLILSCKDFFQGGKDQSQEKLEPLHLRHPVEKQ